MNEEPHISCTQLTTAARCMECYRRVYVKGERRPPGIVLLLGSGVHVGAEVAMREKATTGHDKPPNDVRDAAVAGFDERMAKEDVLLTKDERSVGKANVVGRSRDRVAALSHYWGCVAQPEYMPEGPDAIEDHWTIPLPKLGIELVGVTDLRATGGIITDWKTCFGRRIGQGVCDTSIQLTAYSLAYEREMKVAPAEVRLDVLQEKKAATDRYVLKSQRTHRDYQTLLYRIEQMLGAVRSGYFPPCNGDQFFCSEKWCGFWSDCPAINRERLRSHDE